MIAIRQVVFYNAEFMDVREKGDVPMRYRSLAKYLARYVVSALILIRRIDVYDGKRVRCHYRSHLTKRVEED